MKLKNLKVDKKNIKNFFEYYKNVVFRTIFLMVVLGYGISYYNYNSQKQIENNVDLDNVFVDEDGAIYAYFEPFEHYIKISRNDSMSHTADDHDGYQIQSVTTNSWRDNVEIIYVNEDAVIVPLTEKKDEILYFSEFGTVVNEKPLKFQKIK